MTPQTVCPYCCADLGSVDATREHVVPQALGGSETVRACKRCNNSIGSSLEGRLLGPTSWLTVIAQAAGYAKGFVRVTNQNGQSALEHFGGREGRLLEPHVEVIEETAERARLQLTLPTHLGNDYIDYIVRKHGGKLESVERGTPPPQTASATFSVSTDDLAALSAKVALCAGTLLWGDDLLLSELGEWLRAGVHDPQTLRSGDQVPAGPPSDSVRAALDAVLAHFVATGGVHPWRSPVPSLTIFAPVAGGDATVITTVLFGIPISTIGKNLPKPGAMRVVTHFHPYRSPEAFRIAGR